MLEGLGVVFVLGAPIPVVPVRNPGGNNIGTLRVPAQFPKRGETAGLGDDWLILLLKQSSMAMGRQVRALAGWI